MTFPKHFLDHPSSVNFPFDYTASQSGSRNASNRKDVDYTNYEEGIYVGYRYFDSVPEKVVYPFGFGLSYTTFSYSSPVVKLEKDDTITASVKVTNTGSVAGKEAVQIYVSAPAGGLEKPAKELKSFAKTKSLEPGESQTLTFKISPYDLASFNENASQWETADGTYSVMFAASSQDIRCKASFKLRKTIINPR